MKDPKKAQTKKNEGEAGETGHVNIDIRKLKSELRIAYGGGYFRKVKKQEGEGYDWIRSTRRSADFMTLYRKIVKF